MENEKLATIYCRVACMDDDAIAHQESMLLDYATKHGYSVAKVYKDNGFSGLNFERPAFQELLADIESGLIGTVIVKDSSRISRNWQDLHGLFQRFHSNKADIKYVAVMDNMSMSGSVLGDMQTVIMQYHRKIHSEKIKQGIALKKAKLMLVATDS